jgi:hypothetical protein
VNNQIFNFPINAYWESGFLGTSMRVLQAVSAKVDVKPQCGYLEKNHLDLAFTTRKYYAKTPCSEKRTDKYRAG